jgi:FkbM family methyltransferase
MHESQEHKDVMGQMPSLPDHTQHGELAKIIKHVMRKGSKYNIVVDAGARGKERSNSFDLLSHFNWRGLLIEANPALHAPIRREFGGLDFTLEGCAVGLEAGTLPFYIGVNDDVSSLNTGASQVWGDIKEVVDVEVKRLPDILQAHSIPYDFDLLSVDIESLDMPVFNDLIASSPYRPSVVILEVTPELDRTSMKNIEASEIVCANYGLADVTPSNVIAVRKF